MLKTAFCDRFDVNYPIILAPMAGVTNPNLGAEVRKAGILPSMGCGAMNAEALDKSMTDFMALVAEEQSPLININFFAHQEERVDEIANRQWLEKLRPLFDDFEATTPTQLDVIYRSFLEIDDARMDVLLAHRPQIVSFHFGLPSTAVIEKLKNVGIAIFASACHVDEAKQLDAAGVDYIVAQGYEAGGHRGIFDPDRDEQLGTMALLEQIKQQCTTPVIVSGGIMTGQEIRQFIEAGAEAVQLGTAFVLCPESSAPEAYRQQLRESAKSGADTVVSAAISGRPARGLKTKLTELGDQLTDVEGLKLPVYPALYDANKQLNGAALKQGDVNYGAYWSGTGLAQIRELPAQELVALLIQEALA